VPVIATAVNTIADMVIEWENGFWVEHDAAQIARGLTELDEDRSLH